MATVEAGARLHVGFQNLSLAYDRIYGGIGIAIQSPTVIVSAEPAEQVSCSHDLAQRYATIAIDHLSLPGAEVNIKSELPRHVGLGSGTQLALAVSHAIASAYGADLSVRSIAPKLGRGGRSGIGVAGFEKGGFIIDGGHPTARFTSNPPSRGEWEVPPVIARQPVPDRWRFLLVIPDLPKGRNGETEEESMRSIIEQASPDVANKVSGILSRRLLPSIVMDDIQTAGDAITTIDQINGSWYSDEQGGVYRPPVGDLIDNLRSCESIAGVGQSSWGPTVYALTTESLASKAKTAANDALGELGLNGRTVLTCPDNDGASVK